MATAEHLPLSFDESYFWLWSKHLALSYYDHPPLIALSIRAGTLIFGDDVLGVRAGSLLCSIAGSFALWRAASLLTCAEDAGAVACTLFNATLMANSQFIVATPDALVMAAMTFLLLSIAQLQHTGKGCWWLGIAASLGMALLSKYTALFLVAGTGLWCLGTRQGRHWLSTPWPHLAALLATLCLAPALIWNAENNWISFRFQFGRVTTGSLGFRYLVEFALAQLALASPLILWCGLSGLWRATKSWRASPAVLAAAAFVWPALIYFTLHTLHDRVQGNWPSFIYPAIAVLAAWSLSGLGRTLNRARIAEARALSVALLMVAAAYLQAWTGLLAVGKRDPLARMLGFGVESAARQIGAIAANRHAAAIVTGKYATTGWLSFYMPQPVPIVQIADEQRWLETPKADTALLNRPLLFVTQEPAHETRAVHAHFSMLTLIAEVPRNREAVPLDKFYVYSLSGFHGAAAGRLVNGWPR